MYERKVGSSIVAHPVFLITLFIIALAIFVMTSTKILSGNTTQSLIGTIDTADITLTTTEKCVPLGNPWLDHWTGQTNYYNIPDVPVNETVRFALWFDPGLVSLANSWDLREWSVACDGLDGSNPKTYTLVKWPYYDIYPEGYLHIDSAFILPRKNLIDPTNSVYKPEWKCNNAVRVMISTAATFGAGTNADVKLCYYSKKKSPNQNIIPPEIVPLPPAPEQPPVPVDPPTPPPTPTPPPAPVTSCTKFVAKTGNDASPGTESQPWLTIQKAANTAVAGDTVCVKEGTYKERVIPKNSGASGNWIVYAAYPGHERKAIIDGTGLISPSSSTWNSGTIHVSSKTYIRVAGFYVKNSGGSGIYVGGGNNIEISGNRVEHTAHSGIQLYGAGAVNNYIVKGNEINKHGYAYSDWEALSIADVNGFDVGYNIVYDPDPGVGPGARILIDAKAGSKNGVIHHNEVYSSLSNSIGLYVDAWKDTLMENIVLHSNKVHDIATEGIALNVEIRGTLQNVKVYNNIIYNAGKGGDLGSGIVISSYVWEPSDTTLGARIIKNIEIYSNTVYGSGASNWPGGGIIIGREASRLQLSNVNVKNNLVFNNNKFQIRVNSGVTVAGLVINNNLAYPFMGYSGEVHGTIESDPQFVNPSAGDFHLQPSSPAIDKGASLGAPYNVDYAGAARPAGAAYDMGAYEYGGTLPIAATPAFSPEGRTYPSAQIVTISTATAGATIRYTTDGTTPASTSTAYTAPFSVSSTKTIKAKAFKAGLADSAVASATYTISGTTAGDTSIVINPDKTISIGGKKTFPVGMYSICNRFYEDNANPPAVTPCDPYKNRESLFDAGASLYGYQNDAYFQSVIPKYESNKIYWTVSASSAQSALIGSPYLFGYYQLDEPKDGTTEWLPHTTQADCQARKWYSLYGFWSNGKCYYPDARPLLSSNYINAKAKDPNHPVILNLWEKMTTWTNDPARTFADIITWDTYTIADDPNWLRSDSVYAYEHYSERSFFRGTNINSVAKPVWAVIQANGINQQATSTRTLLPPAPKEARANTYTAITMDVKGIVFYGYEIWSGWPVNAGGNYGLYSNATLHTYYRQLERELAGINGILVLPTKDYSWHYRKGTSVTFSNSLTKYVLWATRTNFNYMLKQNSTATYLIVVNKDSRPISNVDVTIAGLAGTMTARTMGLETSGSARANRILAVTNGKFTDSFDGYAVHVYEIV